MKTKTYYSFSDSDLPEISEVGGKALSLMKLTKGGFPVPGGSVLTVAFFKDWLENLQADNSIAGMWRKPESFIELAGILKRKASGFIFSEDQKSVILGILGDNKDVKLFAVRSSSPEEDLAGASFAGGYETILGVTGDRIFDAVKKAFISCLDERVFFYKHQNGFDTSVLRIAVVIQQQIPSEASGVGFSLNPINNCYDEIVINANTGLGESVVSGMISPDEFVVDGSTNEIIERKIGSKEQEIILLEGGGTGIVDGRRGEPSLTDAQVYELAGLVGKVEEYYGFPVDIEWAFSEDQLYLLQSRPITTWVPLPDELQTAPGESKLLYLDGSLTKQGITSPISVLGCDCIGLTQKVMFTDMMGFDATEDLRGGMGTTRGGRMYLNLSTMIKFQGFKRVVGMWKTVDVSTSRLLTELDLRSYIPDKLPAAMKGALWGTVKNNLPALKKMRRAAADPAAYKRWYQPFEDDFDRYLKAKVKDNTYLRQSAYEITERYIDLLNRMLPMTYAAELARKALGKQLGKLFDDGGARMQYLERSLPDNVTIDMGMRMYEISQTPEILENDGASFMKKLESGVLPAGFMKLWNAYLDEFGCRTANELDAGVPRMSEKPEELFEQIKGMSGVSGEFSPVAVYNESLKLREKTFEELLERLSGGAKKKFRKKYDVLVRLGGKREALKYWYVRTLDAIRKIALERGRELAEKGLLARPDDIFRLNFDIVCDAEKYSREELQSFIDRNDEYYRLLGQVHGFPNLIDSRGRILRMPAAAAKEGEIAGQPISPGIVRGRVKVLHTPDEKPLNKGEIMVTRATDPGWTPLFINAAAIVLEVGGLLQHGALVAREYGKACIAGVDGVMDILEDGQLVEVDGASGLIRLLDQEEAEGNEQGG